MLIIIFSKEYQFYIFLLFSCEAPNTSSGCCLLLVLLPRRFLFQKAQCSVPFPESNHIRNIRRWLIFIHRYSLILNSNRGYQRLPPKPGNLANYEELYKYEIITFYFLFLLKYIFLRWEAS